MTLETHPLDRLLTTDVVTVTPETTIVDAASMLRSHDIGSLVVVDDAGTMQGMVTSTDLVDIVSTGTIDAEATVSEYMSTDVVTLDEGSDVSDAASKMIRNRVQHLPLLAEDGSVVGLLSATDLTGYLSFTGGSDI